ncbi:DivIVA domain-containing protein [Janibacter sp. GS2]|uniref:DivIVA domain-containing protein n=1 Tax=Janibacter sp. GS2 TaxID=3442646 RepID=UPI003EBB109F
MIWIVLLLVALVVVVGFAAVITGRLTPDPMADPVSSTPDHGLPPGDFRAEAIDGVRFDTALRGYRMDQVDEVIDRLRVHIAELESVVGPVSSTAEPLGRTAPGGDERDRA